VPPQQATMMHRAIAVLQLIVAAQAQRCPGANVTKDLGLGAVGAGGTTTHSQTLARCCGICTADEDCLSWTFQEKDSSCITRHIVSTHRNQNKPGSGKTSGIMIGRSPHPPAPPPPPLPPPPPAPAGSQRNVIFITTDDQDLMLGSMRALPNVVQLIAQAGANLTHFRVNTPICCPSRSTMLTGRYEHNNRVSSLAGGGCMHMNSSRFDNPDFWESSSVVRLHKLGYTTGFFGKVRKTPFWRLHLHYK
jgi:hypothetical protein